MNEAGARQDITYCQTIEKNARSYAQVSAGFGWTLGLLSVAAIAAGAITVGTADDPTRGEKIVSLSLPALGAIVGYGAVGLFKRSEKHSELAAAAAIALNTPEDAVKSCNQALAAWNTNRSEASAALIAALQAKKTAEEAKAAVQDAQANKVVPPIEKKTVLKPSVADPVLERK